MEEIDLIQQKIYTIRGQRVMLDKNLAELYGVEVKRLNESVKRNIERFPADFMFQLNQDEWQNLKSQFATTSWGGSRTLPYAFTEQGVAMLSSVLRSKTAIEVNIRIMRAFVTVRQYLTTRQSKPNELEHRIKQIEETINDILTDQNDINEDTRMRLELIEETLTILQTNEKQTKRTVITGFTK